MLHDLTSFQAKVFGQHICADTITPIELPRSPAFLELRSSRSSEGTEKPNLSLPVLNLTLRSAAPVERSERSSVAGEAEWFLGAAWVRGRRGAWLEEKRAGGRRGGLFGTTIDSILAQRRAHKALHS